MPSRNLWLAIWLLGAASAASGAVPPGLQAAVTNASVLARRFIPSDRRREGEVRLLRVGGETRLQVLLYTRSLGKAMRQIRENERANWPEGSEFSAVSAAFLEHLAMFRDHLRERRGGRAPGEAALFRALVEFCSGEGRSEVVFAEVDYEERDGEKVPVDRTEYEVLSLPRGYISANIVHMVRDGFDLTDEQAAEWLAIP